MHAGETDRDMLTIASDAGQMDNKFHVGITVTRTANRSTARRDIINGSNWVGECEHDCVVVGHSTAAAFNAMAVGEIDIE